MNFIKYLKITIIKYSSILKFYFTNLLKPFSDLI